MGEAVEVFTVGQVRVSLYYDQDAQPPHECGDEPGILVTWHRRYRFQEDGSKVFGSPEEFRRQAAEGRWVYLPVGMYDHSGISFYEGEDSHPMDEGGWDSGQVGYIYCTPELADKILAIKKAPGRAFTKGQREKILKHLRGLLKSWDEFVTGEVFGYVVEDAEGNELDSCWGLYGREYAEQVAREAGQETDERLREGGEHRI